MTKIKIIIKGTIENYYGANEFISSLKKHYPVNVVPEPQYSEMGDIVPQPIEFTFQINEALLIFLAGFIAVEAAKYVLKRYFFEPFFDSFEKLENFNNHLSVGFFVFQYEDIKVKVGYSRGSQINVVSKLNVELLKRISRIRQAGLGDLSLVAAPVINEYEEWRFQESFDGTFDSYLKHWGLIYNEMNRLVYQLKPEEFIYEHWWD